MRKSKRSPCPDRRARPSRARSAIAIAIAVIAAASCGAPETRTEEAAPELVLPARGQRVLFAYSTLDGQPLSTETVAGRITVIGFIATYDPLSQAQAQLLRALLRRHTPRLNVAALVLEPPENKPMAEAFIATLELNYPVALADEATIAGSGPFTGLHHVPSVVVLDREGREAWRHLGPVHTDALEAVVRAVEKSYGRPTAAAAPR